MLNLLLVSFPEEFMLILVALAAAGKKDILDFSNKIDMVKLCLLTTMMVVFSYILGQIIPKETYKSLINFIVFFLAILLSFKLKIKDCIIGFTISILILVIGETVFLSLISFVCGVTLEQMQVGTAIRFVCTIPERLLQVAVLVMLMKYKNIKIVSINKRPTVKGAIEISFLILAIVTSMLSVEAGVKHIHNDIGGVLKLIMNLIIMFAFIMILVYSNYKLESKAYIESSMHNVDLNHIKNLIKDGQYNYAINLIDLTLLENGYYKQNTNNNQEEVFL